MSPGRSTRLSSRSATDDAGRREWGFSILEIIIALAILMTVLAAVSSLLQTSFKIGANSRYEQQATAIASATLDQQLASGVSTLLGQQGDTALTPVLSSGQTYLLEREVAPYDPAYTQCQSPASDPGAMLKVTIWATWTDQKAGATWWLSGSSAATKLLVQETSLLAVPASAINPTLGSILVSIQGATGNPIANVSVTATPSSGSPQTVTTSAGGCALFANVAVSPTTWTISFATLSGYLTEQNLTTLPTQSNLSVAAGSTTSITFSPGASAASATAYDRAATVNAVYSVPMADGVHPILPSNINSLPLSFYSSNLVVSPYVSASPASVFPMAGSPGYYVVAGSCGTESAPDGGTTDGQPVTLTAGGTGSPTIPLVPVQIFVQQGASLVSGAAVTAAVKNAAGTGTDTNCPTSGTTVMPTLNLSTTTATWSSKVRGKHRRHAYFVWGCSSNCSTSTTLSTPSTATYGSPVTLSATVTCDSGWGGWGCSPVTGTVDFYNGGTFIGSDSSLNNGVASISTSALPVGSLSITATYEASGKWTSSTSWAKTQTITAAPTTTTVTSNPNPSAYGASAILTATVAASSPSTATPTGTVTFKNGGSDISGCVSLSLSAGSVDCTLSGLAGGSYSVTAAYAPSPANFAASTSSTLTQQVTALSTSTTLTSSANPSSWNSPVTLTATVTAASGGPAQGSVAFMNGSTTLATVALNGFGMATYTTSASPVGSTVLSAVFTATNSGSFATSTGTVTQVVSVPAGTPYTLVGLPYGVWLLSATWTNPSTHVGYSSATEAVQVVIKVTPSGFYIASGGSFASSSLLGPGASVTVNVQ
ncbi:MAG TPA: Ig-like domain repeat protein [Acidimicrobiales bacterium]|nr:Ig-like domain repeat protein [Acidimicrobiales bacterium]